MSHPATLEFPEKNADSGASAAPGAAVDAKTTRSDPDLQALIDCWPRLTEEVRSGIISIVRAMQMLGKNPADSR